MKKLFMIAAVIGALALPAAVFAQSSGCSGCGHAATAAPAVGAIPGTNETIPVGRIENLAPVAVLTVLGCEKCAEEATNWALKQGSSPDDIERVLRTVAAMQNLECFKQQFGPDVVARMEKPLAAARHALQLATERAATH